MNTILNFLLPSQCLLCRKELHQGRICMGCMADISLCALDLPCCQQCLEPLVTDAPLCGNCLSVPPAFNFSLIPFNYHHPVDYLVQRFKYNNCQASGQILGQQLADYLQQQYDANSAHIRPDIIIPTPLHWRRCFSRGFNQTAIIARIISRKLGIPVTERKLERIRHTNMQKGLNRKKRATNIRGAFYISEKNTAVFKNKTVAILDDVVTTTTTVREISRVVRKAGAKEVHIWALARTPLN